MEKAEIIVHSVGVLFDSTSWLGRGRDPRDTYEAVQRDSLMRVVDAASAGQGPRKTIVYMSGEGHPPFMPRYETSKREAEQYLLGSKGVAGAVVKPGFITSSGDRGKQALEVGVRLWRGVYPLFERAVRNIPKVDVLAEEFRVAAPIDLESVATAVLGAAVEESCHGRVLLNPDILRLEQDLLLNR